MKPSALLSCAAPAAIVALVLAAACSGAHDPALEPKPASSVVDVSTSANAHPSASAGPGTPQDAPAMGGWMDEEVVAALAEDCHWDPDGCLGKMEQMAKLGPGVEFPVDCMGNFPLACAQVASQVCVPDECSQTDYDCVPECDKSCQSCAGSCVSSCDACKTKCTDAACKLTCAKGCAQCRQSCVTKLDHCTTAHCSEVSETCFKERDAEWDKSTCSMVCPKVQTCVEACAQPTDGSVYMSSCAESCAKRLMKGCPARFSQICMGNPDAAVNFNIAHERLHMPTPP